MEKILLKPTSDPDLYSWVILNSDNKPTASAAQGSMQTLSTLCEGRRLVLLAPTTDIVLRTIELPGKNKKRLLQAAPYALEEDLADDIEILHFALGEVTSGDGDEAVSQVPLAAIRKGEMEQWLDVFTEYALRPAQMIPSVLTLPYQAGQWTILLENQLAEIRTGLHEGFVCDSDNLNLFIEMLLSDEGVIYPNRFMIYNYDQDAMDIAVPESIEVEVDQPASESIMLNAQGYARGQWINLMQGDYAFKEEYFKLFKPWKVPAAIAAGLMAFSLIGSYVQLWQLRAVDEQLTQQIEATYLEIFPGSRNTGNARYQVEQRLAELTGNQDNNQNPFIDALNHASDGVANVERARVLSMNFAENSLIVELSVPTVQVLDELKTQLDNNSNYSVEIQSASSEGETVTGNLRLTARS